MCVDVGVKTLGGFVFDSDVGSVSSGALGAVHLGVCSHLESVLVVGCAVVEVVSLCNSLVFDLLLIEWDVPFSFIEFDSKAAFMEFEFGSFSWCNLVLIVQGMPFSFTIFEAAITEFEAPRMEFEADSSSWCKPHKERVSSVQIVSSSNKLDAPFSSLLSSDLVERSFSADPTGV